MYGEASPCLFLVFSNSGPGGDESLARWYMEVHGPDSFENGTFYALHRYQAVGDYEARFLALWEGTFRSREEAHARMTRGAPDLKKSGRITDDLIVVWSMMSFLSVAPLSVSAGPVSTLSLLEGGYVEQPGATTYRYGDLTLYESATDPSDVAASWPSGVKEGMAPYGPYKNIFDHPDSWPPTSAPMADPWVSHWRPIASLRRNEV